MFVQLRDPTKSWPFPLMSMCVWYPSGISVPVAAPVTGNTAGFISGDEVALVRRLFRQARSYLDVYDRYGLMRPRAMYGHCIWLNEQDRLRMAETRSAAAISYKMFRWVSSTPLGLPVVPEV